MCCTRLLEIQDAKMTPKNRHLGTIVQLYRAESSQLRHVSTIRKKQQYLLNMSAQYDELRPTSSWDLLASLGHPSKFQRVLHLGSVTARHSSSGRQPNFAALNRGRHIYSAERPSRWALAHISSLQSVFATVNRNTFLPSLNTREDCNKKRITDSKRQTIMHMQFMPTLLSPASASRAVLRRHMANFWLTLCWFKHRPSLRAPDTANEPPLYIRRRKLPIHTA